MALSYVEQLDTLAKCKGASGEMMRRIELLSDAERAYLAGIFDGEGCVVLYKDKMCEVSKRGYPIFRCYLFIANTSLELILHLYKMTGIGTPRDRKTSGKRRPLFDWRVGGTQDILDLIEAMHPFSIVKKRQLEIVYEVVSTFKRNNFVTAEVNARRERLFKELQSILHPDEKLGEFGEHPKMDDTEPSSRSGEGVEVSPEIMDISAQPNEADEMTRATQQCVELQGRYL